MASRILIVEDEPAIAESLSFVLDHAGFQVAVESDGSLAIDRVSEHGAEVVILDVMLPNRSGFDILAELRAGPHAGLPVLMLTAKGQKKDRETAQALGTTVFMTKPFSNREVVRVVQALLEASHGRPAATSAAR